MSDNKTNEFKINGVQYKCRTCFDPGRQVYSLTDKCSDSKTWRHLLNDVAQLQVNEDEFLPNTICCKCLDKLISYYDFLLQVQNVSKKYCELITNYKNTSEKDILPTNVGNSTQCLAESAIALPLEQFVSEIKFEDERIVPYDIVWKNASLTQEDVNEPFKETCMENMEAEDLQIQQRSLKVEINDLEEISSSCSEESEFLPENYEKKCDNNKNTNSLTSTSEDEDLLSTSESFEEKTIKNHPDLFKITQVGNSFNCTVCKKSFTSQQNCRRHVLKIHCSKKNMFPCGFCDHIASRKEYLKAHIKRRHPGESFKSNIKQVVYRFGDFIYSKPSPWRLVECNLCNTNFVTTKQLRQHLQNHSDPRTLDSLKLDSSIVQRWFPGLNLISVKATISKNIREQDWFRYYTVLNEYCFELSVSDTEEEDLEEERQGKYMCALCAKYFLFKYEIYAHSKEEHSKHEIPFKCCNCKLEFVSMKMYEQHKQIHCRNKYKIFQCSYCPGKFFSKLNIENHSCARQIPNADTDSEIAGKSLSLHITKAFIDPNEKCDGQNILDSDSDQEHIDEFLENSNNQELFETLNDAASPMPSETQRNICIESSINCKTQGQLNDNQTSSNTTKTFPDTMVNIRYCYLCPKTFYNIDQLNDHLGRHRLKPAAIKTVESIVHSTWWPNGKKIIKCKICDLQFASMVELKEHFAPNNLSSKCSGQNSLANYSITNEKGFELHLELDSETESESEAQRKHDKTSTELQPYKCQMCNRTFKRKYQIAQHQRSMHNYELLELKCECCVFKTVSQKVLDYHTATQCGNVEKKHQCRQCNFIFMWKENLANHISMFHIPKESTQIDYAANTDLRRHGDNNEHNGLFSTPEIATTAKISNQHPPPSDDKKPKLVCPICGKYISPQGLNYHIRLHTDYRPYKCDICGKAYVKKSCVVLHRRRHFADRPFKCEHCTKSFVSRHILNKHMRQHTGERPYECNICQKKYGRTDYLKLHMLNHTGEKPFKCAVCEQRFKCQAYLKKHMIKNGHHNEQN